MGLLLDFFLLGFGDLSDLFFLPAGVVSVLLPVLQGADTCLSVVTASYTCFNVV